MSGYQYNTLSAGDEVTGINSAGTVVGNYVVDNPYRTFGFIYDPASQTYTSLSGPDADGSDYYVDATGINASGTVIGDFDSSSGKSGGFIYDPSGGGSYTTFAGPDGAGVDTGIVPVAINASGEVLFTYDKAVAASSNYSYSEIEESAIYNPATDSFTVLPEPSSTTGFDNVEVIATGLNDSGNVVGDFVGLSGNFSFPQGGFIYDSATSSYKLLTPTGSEANDQTAPTGINDSGEVIGTYVAQGFQGPMYEGAFTYNPAGGGTFTDLSVSGYEVLPTAIDAAGDVAVAEDAQSAYDNFSAVYGPDGTYTTLSPAGSGPNAGPVGINDSGEVIIYASNPTPSTDDPSGNPESYIAEPLCFLRGTNILTPTGEVFVEALKIGDLVVTRFNGIQPVKWIGRQSYAARFVRNNPDKLPVRIRAHALGEKFPVRDLYVSPGHSVLHGGNLILARCLVNGITITQGPAPEQIDYFCIELETHDCVIAEGAFAETFADGPGLRAQFHNAAEYFALYPDSPPPDELLLCAPRPERGAKLDAALRPVVARATAGVAPGPLEGFIDLVTEWLVEGWALDLNNPALPALLEIVLDGKIIGTALACDFREDLKAAGKGNGRCAFAFKPRTRIPAALFGQLYIRRAADGAEIHARHPQVPARKTMRPNEIRAVA